MNILGELREYLLADAAIAAVVGTRIYPLAAPQSETRDRIVVQMTTGIRISPLNGVSTLARPRYQVASWSTTYAGAVTLGGLVLVRLENKNLTWTDTSSPAISVGVQIEFIDERDLFEGDVNGNHYRRVQDYYIWHGTSGGQV